MVIVSIPGIDADRLVDRSDSCSACVLLEVWPWCSGLSDMDGAGEIETELALLAEEVVTSVSSLGRLPHSRYRLWLDRLRSLDRASRRCAAE